MTSYKEKLINLTSPVIIAIAGDSGSGKTTYSNGIRRMFGTDIVKTITMDGYHKENRSERLKNGKLPLDPSINNLDLLLEHLGKMKKGLKVEIPIYNHKTGDFEEPIKFSPSPVVIVEGLHALYPEFLPFLDFTIYVDPSREVKWRWKYDRDINKRGHLDDELVREMLKRETAYKRWIDFQKTNANIIIKILPSEIKNLARYESIFKIPDFCYKVTLIMDPQKTNVPHLELPFDLSAMLGINEPPFMLAAVPSMYWGKKMTVVHLDGIISQRTVRSLEDYIVSQTGIPVERMLQQPKPNLKSHEELTAVQFAQLLIAWRFLEVVNQKLT